MATKVVTCGRVEWAILSPIFLALLQTEQRIVIPSLVRTFCACQTTDYVPLISYGVRLR